MLASSCSFDFFELLLVRLLVEALDKHTRQEGVVAGFAVVWCLVLPYAPVPGVVG